LGRVGGCSPTLATSSRLWGRRQVAAGGAAQPAFVLDELDAVVARHRLESLQIAAANRTKDGVV
jgi:hypothetical protein